MVFFSSATFHSSHRITLKAMFHLFAKQEGVEFRTLAESSSLKVPRGHTIGSVVPCGQ